MPGGFQLFTQPQGPSVSISLFGDAAQAGARLGAEIPDPISSAIQGGIKGYQQGQQMQAADQQSAMRQNEISQFGVDNQQKQANLDATLLDNQQKLIDQKDAANENSLANQDEVATQRLRIAKATQEEGQIDEEVNLNRNIASMSPEEQQKHILNMHADLFSQNPGLQQNLIRIYGGNFDAAGKSQAKFITDKKGVLDYQTKNQPKYDADVEAKSVGITNGDSTGLFDEITSSGLDPEKVLQNSTLERHGRYTADANGDVVIDPNTEKPVESTAVDTGAKSVDKRYDSLYTDPITQKKKLYTKSSAYLDQDYYKKFSGWKAASHLASGNVAKNRVADLATQRDSAIAQANGSGGNGGGDTQTAQPKILGQNDFSLEGYSNYLKPDAKILGKNDFSLEGYSNYLKSDGTVPAVKPNYVQMAQTIMPIGDPTAIAVEPHLKQLYQLSAAEVSNPALRNNPASIQQKAQVMRQAVRAMTNNEFSDSKALQAQITQADVDAENASIKEQVRPKGLSLFNSSEQNISLEQMAAPYYVKTPADVYFRRNADIKAKQIQTVVDEYNNHHMATVQAQTASTKTAPSWVQKTSS